jgi:hypothetical protein
MPRYFFILKSATEEARDDEGEDLPDDAAAHRAAVQTASELENWDRFSEGTLSVQTEDGRLVTEVPLRGRSQ